MTNLTTFIDVIRHGEPCGGEVFRGRTDHTLTELGQWQFKERLNSHPFEYDRIISSPLVRCQESASSWSQQQQIPLEIVEHWQEIDFGDWEDQLISEVMSEHCDHAQQMWQDPLSFCAPNGESVLALQERIEKAWRLLVHEYKGKNILVVTHGGVMRVLAQKLLLLEPAAMSRLSIPYAGLMRFRIDYNDSSEQHWVSLDLLDGRPLCL